tara:strand:- start:1705 stop:1980 length:276 start_codon:yes stop_codon:yes gene_type:complete
MTKIDFISAENGGIKFYGGRDDVAMELNCVGFAKTPEMVNYIIKTRGLADRVMHSSSMDFANEYGFDNHDGAWILWQDGVELDDKKAAGVA